MGFDQEAAGPTRDIARTQSSGAVGAGVSLTLAGMAVAILGWMPGQIVMEILTLLTVEAASVVLADAGPVNLGR